MKSTTLICTGLIAALGFGTIAQAQPAHDWRDGDRGGRDHQQHQWQGRVQAQPQQHWQGQRQWQAPAYNHQYVHPQYSQRTYNTYNNYAPRSYAYGGHSWAAPQYRAYGYAPRHYGYAGGYVPYDWRSHRWWAADWRARNLYAPPYGYQWIETDAGDVLLVALATGLIANAILAQ